jgi:hypothetical protein
MGSLEVILEAEIVGAQDRSISKRDKCLPDFCRAKELRQFTASTTMPSAATFSSLGQLALRGEPEVNGTAPAHKVKTSGFRRESSRGQQADFRSNARKHKS